MLGSAHAAAATSEVTLSGNNLTLVSIVAVVAVVALAMGVVFRRQVLAADEGTERMREIGRAIQEGASAYLNRQFRTLAVFVGIVFVLLFALPADTATIRIARSARLPGRRAVLRGDRLLRHEPRRARQRPRGLGGPRERPRRGHEDRVPHRWHGRHGDGGSRPARRVGRRPHLQGRRPVGARGLRLRRRPARDVHACRRRHLHEGRGRRRRPRRQDRAGHPRGRPAQRGHDRRQRRRQRRRLRRHGRGPLRVVRRDARRRADPRQGGVRRGRPRVPADRARDRRAHRGRSASSSPGPGRARTA